jgi:site-specific DNA-methyltransferase (adenine-specific)
MTTRAFNQDCMEAMAEMEDNAFDLAIVDPPYGIKRDNTFHGSGGFYETWTTKNEYPQKDWDADTPTREYFEQLIRVSQNVIVCGGNYFTEHLPTARHWIVWDKQNTMPTFSDCELIYTNFDRSSVKKFVFGWNGLMAREKSRIHPTQKPVALYKWLLTNYAKPGQRILDTHLGSGSSRIAAYDLGFDFTGYELDADYFNAQEARFANHIAQPNFFQPQAEVKQEAMFA